MSLSLLSSLVLVLSLLSIVTADDVKKQRRQLDLTRIQYNIPPTSAQATYDHDHTRALANLPYLTPSFFAQQDISGKQWLTSSWGVNFTTSIVAPDGFTYGDFIGVNPGWAWFPFEVGSQYRNDNVTNDSSDQDKVKDNWYYITAGGIFFTLRSGSFSGYNSGASYTAFDGLIYTRINLVARSGDLTKPSNYEWLDCLTPRTVKQVVDMYSYFDAMYYWECKDSNGKSVRGSMTEFYKPTSDGVTRDFFKQSTFLWDQAEKSKDN